MPMDSTQCIAGTLSVIPDVLNSLASATESPGEVEATDPSPAQASSLALVRRLAEAVESVREVLDTDSAELHGQIPSVVDDGVECCRLLASALNCAWPGNSTVQGQALLSSYVPAAREFTNIAARVAESLELVCDVAHLKNVVLQGEALRQGEARKAIRQLNTDYEALALLVHRPAAVGKEHLIPSKSRQAATEAAPGEGQGLSVSDAFRWCREVLFTDDATRRSQAIDRELLQEPQEPWSISAVLTAGWFDATEPLFHALRALLFPDKQALLGELREKAASSIEELLEIAMRKPSPPLRAHIESFRERLGDAGGVYTDDVSKAFEGLWRCPDLHRLEEGALPSAKSFNNVLGHMREIMREGYTVTTADVAFILEQRGGIRSSISLQRGAKRIDLFQRVCGSSTAKKWGLYLGHDLPVVVHVVDLRLYETEDLPAGSDGDYLSHSLLFFESTLESRRLVSTTVLLFLINYSGFAERLKTKALSRRFPDYRGGDDAGEAAAFVKDKFLEVAQKSARRHRVRTRICDVLDAENVDFIFTSVDHAMRWKHIHDMRRRRQALGRD